VRRGAMIADLGAGYGFSVIPWAMAPPVLSGSRGGAGSGLVVKHHLGLPGEGFTREYAHPAKWWYVPQLK